MRKKVLYLHGLNSKLHSDRQEVLEKFDLDIASPIIDYENEPGKLKDLINDFDADMIIGSSAGGLVGYYISGLLDVPALLFNPALPFRNYMPEIPNLTSRRNFLQIVLGANDEVVSAMETFHFLLQNLDKEAPVHIHWIQDLQHTIPIKVFETEVQFFLENLTL